MGQGLIVASAPFFLFYGGVFSLNIVKLDSLKKSFSTGSKPDGEDFSNLIDTLSAVDTVGKKLKNVCLFYGYPISINGLWSVNGAVDFYKQFDVLVFGDGYQNPSHETHLETVEIIDKVRSLKPSIEVFGYVKLGQHTENKLSIEEIKSDIDKWKSSGVTGIFLDEYGYDYFVPRSMQNEAVGYAHLKGMNVIANSWKIDWVFSPDDIYLDWIDYRGNPSQLNALINERDYVLFENMFYYHDENGDQKAQDQWRIYEAVRYEQETQQSLDGMTFKEAFGTKTIALDSIVDISQRMFTNSYIGSIVLGIDGLSVSPMNWGAGYPDYKTYKIPDVKLHDSYSTVVNDFEGSTYSKFEKNTGKELLTLLWKPDEADIGSYTSGIRQVNVDGVPLDIISGTSSARPFNPPVGSQYFDTTVNKPIWFNGSSWVDGQGETV